MRDIQKLTDILMDELPDKHPWEGEICKLRDRLIAKGVTVRERGRWEWITEDVYGCTNCGATNHVKEVMGQPDFNFCPNCGADMRGEEDG